MHAAPAADRCSTACPTSCPTDPAHRRPDAGRTRAAVASRSRRHVRAAHHGRGHRRSPHATSRSCGRCHARPGRRPPRPWIAAKSVRSPPTARSTHSDLDMDDRARLGDRDAALAALTLRLRDADRLASALDRGKLEEGAGLAADQVELLDRAEALLESGTEDGNRERVEDALDEALSGRDRGCATSACSTLGGKDEPGLNGWRWWL